MRHSKQIKKFFALSLAAAIAVSVFGCSSTPSGTAASSEAASAASTTSAASAGSETSSLPIVSSPLTLSLFISRPCCTTVNNLGDEDAVKELEKRTGIHINFIHPSAADTGEALSTLLASGSYPDMIRSNLASYSGGIEGAIKDGIIFDDTALVKQYAVSYNAMVEKNNFQKLVVSDNGVQIGFGSTFSCDQFIGKSFSGLAIRQDWLDELGLSVPETVDDWYKVLTAFKEKKNCKIPLGICDIFRDTANVRAQAFVGSYGAGYSVLLNNNKVVYGPIQDSFKTFLGTYSKWYQEGLIASDFSTQTYKNMSALFANGDVGVMLLHPANFPDIYAMVDKTKNPNFKIGPCPYPQVTKGQTCQYRHNHLGINISPILITTQCKHQTEAVRWIDYLYSKDGIDLETWGAEEGKTYTLDSAGVHHFTELITKNPDGLVLSQARDKYTLADIQGQWNWEYEQQQYTLPEQLNSTWGIWSSSATTDNYIPEVITMTADETSAYTNVMAQVDPYAQEMILKFIMGQEPLSNFGNFVSTVNSMGIQNAVAAKEAAYERYLKR